MNLWLYEIGDLKGHKRARPINPWGLVMGGYCEITFDLCTIISVVIYTLQLQVSIRYRNTMKMYMNIWSDIDSI